MLRGCFPQRLKFRVDGVHGLLVQGIEEQGDKTYGEERCGPKGVHVYKTPSELRRGNGLGANVACLGKGHVTDGSART